jgi:hypothetical protein
MARGEKARTLAAVGAAEEEGDDMTMEHAARVQLGGFRGPSGRWLWALGVGVDAGLSVADARELSNDILLGAKKLEALESGEAPAV